MQICYLCYYVIFYLIQTSYFIEKCLVGASNKEESRLAFECKNIDKICPQILKNELDILECVHFSDSPSTELLGEKCQNEVWTYAANLLQYKNMQDLLEPYCRTDMQTLTCKFRDRPGALLKCFIDNINDIKTKECANFVQRLRFLTFLDARALKLFIEECNDDVNRYSCALGKNSEMTLSCLQRHLLKLQKPCQMQVLHLSELQAENIKYDRQLFMKCGSERHQFCKDVTVGSGQVYECLLQHKDEPGMSSQCSNELLRHEQLIAQDYQVSRGLVRACKEDIKNNRCRKSVSDDRDIRLAQILLCLENATRYGPNSVQPKCKEEMLAHRKMLLEDYRLSPELANSCQREISSLCKKMELGGKTIHCLMEYAGTRTPKRISPACYKELENLLKEADVGEDWRADPVLWKSCQSVANVACHNVIGGESRMMSCLMGKIGTEVMTLECEKSLRQILYFEARDFKLDPLLFKACHEEANKLCVSGHSWSFATRMNSKSVGQPSTFVLPCLYTNTNKLNAACLLELRRVMRQRALSVDLHPMIEMFCLEDLSRYCNEKTGKGEEILCLQDNLERLTSDCSVAIYNFTEVQSEYMELNPIITSNCKEVINELCSNVQIKDQDVMDCLIEKKNDPLMKLHLKCRASVEHQQLISLKDYHFTYKFKKACKVHVSRFCPGAKIKSEVVRCLSEVIRNDTLLEQKPHVPKECHQQLRAQLLQLRENIDLNPKLKADCASDIREHCSKVPHGNAKVLECLTSKKRFLSDMCRRRIFNIEKQELTDSFTDYTLISTCKAMLNKFCPNMSANEQPLTCLKKYKYAEDFDYNCRAIVVKRMLEQISDYRFNPNLHRECRNDISNLCYSVIANQMDEKELEGKVIQCLKVQFRAGKLSSNCEHEMVVILREAALNYNLNLLLVDVCSVEIAELCENLSDNIGKGEVEECLKQALYNGQISNKLCKQEIIELLNEAKADIHADPLLYKACSRDIEFYCSHIQKGAGRQLECIIGVLHDNNPQTRLQWSCEKMLKERVEMYKIKAPKKLENLQELYGQVYHSPSKKYFIVVGMSFVGMIFILGMFCGRAMRRSIIGKNK
ncbi:hypothetical protein O3M35_005681 [Rhynocoris fuscipes]|uniref:Golgi apparatus protein 1 n=1 Tax=Rhynocoris fuscipes TaxID=488301 RepID=A0AAW1DPZ9_9HEMI